MTDRHRSRHLVAAVLLVIVIGSAVVDMTRGHYERLVLSGCLAVGIVVAIITLAWLPGRRYDRQDAV